MKLLSALALGLVLSAAVSAQTALRVGSPAPEFNGTDLQGNTVSLSELRGNVVVVTFWTTRCPICHEEFPKLNQVIRSFDGKKVKFLSLTTDNEDRVDAYLKKNPLISTIIPNSFGVVLQYADRDKNGNIDMGYPAFFIINPQGNIQYRSSGYDKTPSLSSTLQQLISSM